jgi:uncharacterized protein (TIGR04255 family)
VTPLNLPEPDETRLANSPLELVVCQIRFENHPEVTDGEFATKFHAALGGQGGRYPKIDVAEEPVFGMTIGPTAVPSMETSTQRGWRMTSADGNWIVTLRSDHVALETSAYTTWAGDFEDRLNEIIDVVGDQIRPAFIQRLGLRYIDRIKELGIDSAQGWKPYIRPEFLGAIAHPDLGDGVVGAQQLLVLKPYEDQEVVCILRHGSLPPEDGRVDYLLDFDIFRQEGRPFDAAQLKAEAQSFNKLALQLFQVIVEDALMEKLR